MPAYSVPFVHSGDPGYAPPLARAPSPTDSIGTDYGPDETPDDEGQLSDREFADMCQRMLRLNIMRNDEVAANFDPLLPKPKSPEEEKSASAYACALFCSLTFRVGLHMQVMYNLRKEVKRLQEDALFEQTVLRGSLIPEQQQPSAKDIDSILQSMMGTAISPAAVPSTSAPVSRPDDFLSTKPLPDFPSPGLADASFSPDGLFARMASSTSTPTIGRRSTRNKAKTRR